MGYGIFQNSTGGFYYDAARVDNAPNGVDGTFADLYFDLNPAAGNGSDLGCEIGLNGQTVFTPGGWGPQAVSGITVASGYGGNTLEFSIPISGFTIAIPGLVHDPALTFPATGDAIALRLSQSFGYSVAGGPSYGPDRLGSVTLAASAVPEPASTAGLAVGLLGLGAARKRRARTDRRRKAAP